MSGVNVPDVPGEMRRAPAARGEMESPTMRRVICECDNGTIVEFDGEHVNMLTRTETLAYIPLKQFLKEIRRAIALAKDSR